MKDSLFKEFASQSKQDWINKIKVDLKGKSIEELDLKISDHVSISPFSHKEDLASHTLAYRKKATNSWNITEVLNVKDYQLSNKLALNFLQLGVSSLVLEFDSIPALQDIEQLFNNIRIDYISLHILLHDRDRLQFIERFISYLGSQSYDLSSLKGSIRARQFVGKEAYESLQLLSENLPLYRSLFISESKDNSLSTDDGLSDILHATYQQIELLSVKGVALNLIKQQFIFQISGGLSYFTEISKVRALRILIDLMCSAYSIEKSTNIYIDYRTAQNTAHDNPDYNKIQVTTQAMAAIAAGVDDLYLSGVNYKDDQESLLEDRRIYNNIQHILQMESYLDRVVDPAAGSYYIEQMTDKIAGSAWNIFRNKVKA